MNESDRIERVLAETPRPSVVEGAHRKWLGEELDRAAQELMSQTDQTMNTPKRTIWTGHLHRDLHRAAMLMVCVLLVSAGWAAEKVYRAAKELYVVSTVESQQRGESPLADPSLWAKNPDDPEAETESRVSIGSMSGLFTMTASSDVEGAKQQANATHDEMKQLIIKKKYKLLKTIPGSDGENQYLYEFELSDGKKQCLNFSLPLENVATWEDYLEKAAERRLAREKLIAESIKAGRFRLVDVDVMLVHVCRDVALGEDILVQRVALPDGTLIAAARPRNVTKDASHAYPQATWMEHRQAIRDGKRELLDVQTTKYYSYEVTLPDGATTTFKYGGEGRLAEVPK